jgi:hypothetical protein
MQWVIICIDWSAPNVVEKDMTKEQAEQGAEMYDEMALRCIAVREDDPRVRYDSKAGRRAT